MRLEDFLAGEANKKIARKGDVIFAEGAQANAAYYIIEGQVEIYKGADSKKTLIATLNAGQIFGEMAILRFDEYTLSARAVTDVSLYIITPVILQKELRATPVLIKSILDMLIERMRDANDTLIDLDSAASH